MAKPSVEFHPEALAEYLAALGWYRERSVTAARRFEEELSRAISQIQDAPQRWATYMSIRRFLLHQFPFQIIYRSVEDRIWVVAVANLRRPGYWRKRL